MRPRPVQIHYRRPPDRVTVFEQTLIDESEVCSITFMGAAALSKPVTAGGSVVLEPGAPIVWFTFPGRWYDVGRFHRRDGTFTGYYANVLTPVEMHGDRWDTTDLCLDVWLGADGGVEVLDEAELDEALARDWIDPETARRARLVAAECAAAARAGLWPPHPVLEWDLAAARAAASPG